MGYSIDLRRKVFAYKKNHKLTFAQTSEHFDINIATLFRWQKKIEPSNGHNRIAYKVDMQALKQDVEKYPDDYQWERAKRLNVGQSTIHYALKKLKLSFKKNTDTP